MEYGKALGREEAAFVSELDADVPVADVLQPQTHRSPRPPSGRNNLASMHSSVLAFLDWGGAVSLGCSGVLALIALSHGADARKLEAAVPVDRLSGGCNLYAGKLKT